MPKVIALSVRGTEETRRNIEKYARETDKKALAFTVKWLRYLSIQSKRRLTKNMLDGASGGQDTNLLRGGITYDVNMSKKGLIMGRWGSHLPEHYAADVEFGTREHFLPFEFFPQIERWARRHGLPVENMWGMTVGGEGSGHPYLGPVKEENEKKVHDDWKKTMKPRAA